MKHPDLVVFASVLCLSPSAARRVMVLTDVLAQLTACGTLPQHECRVCVTFAFGNPRAAIDMIISAYVLHITIVVRTVTATYSTSRSAVSHHVRRIGGALSCGCPSCAVEGYILALWLAHAASHRARLQREVRVMLAFALPRPSLAQSLIRIRAHLKATISVTALWSANPARHRALAQHELRVVRAFSSPSPLDTGCRAIRARTDALANATGEWASHMHEGRVAFAFTIELPLMTAW